MNSIDPSIAPYLVFASTTGVIAAFLWLGVRVFQKLRSLEPLPSAGMQLRVGLEQSPSTLDLALSKLLEQSGIPMRADAYVVCSLGLSSVVGMLVLILTEDFLFVLIGILATLGIMLTIVLAQRSRRRSQVLAELPAAIDMVARALQAGDGLEKSLQKTAERLHGPLKQDLGWCANQLQMGLPMKKALKHMDERSDLFELRMLNSALTINRDTGGDLPRMLERLARVLHDRQEYRRQIAAATAAARLAAFIIGLAGPGLLVYYALQKEYFEGLWQDPSGQFYMALALGLEVVGILWLFVLTKSEL